MRYFITLSYDGTRYHGWQIQPNADSVQERLQEALSTLLRQPVEVVGAGRTDTGVHARMMVAHFDWEEEVTPQSTDLPQPFLKRREPSPVFSPFKAESERALELERFCGKLNKLLPQDIAVQNIRPVAPDMHARFSATSRTYHYYIHTRKDPFLHSHSWQIPYPLDFERMNAAAKVLLEYQDFTSFSKLHTDVKTNLCDLRQARWDELSPGRWRFTITANRFLRNMVRAIVGTLVEVGRGRIGIEELRRIIEAKDRCSAGESVPAKGLFLVDIKY